MKYIIFILCLFLILPTACENTLLEDVKEKIKEDEEEDKQVIAIQENPHYLFYYLKGIKKKIIDYNNYAYCVELEKGI